MDKYPASIKQKVEEQVNHWEEMLSISRQKVELVQDSQLDDVDKLNQLLEQQQERIEAIDKLTRGIGEEIRELGSVGGININLTAYPEYREAVAQIRKIALLIKENDGIAEARVRELLLNTRGKIQSLRNNKKAQEAYLQEDIYSEGWFIDQKK
ncbi:MAG TPA: hypothetical protein GXX58_05230 [Gelria sp.]|jgi:hypothetical protein|nr:hypothetical protein [Gelria sp.]